MNKHSKTSKHIDTENKLVVTRREEDTGIIKIGKEH